MPKPAAGTLDEEMFLIRAAVARGAVKPATIRSLLAAVEAALKHHRREETSWGPVCGGCWTKGGSHPVWPCMPMVDMVEGLLGEVPND
jgi:hypothetical protein